MNTLIQHLHTQASAAQVLAYLQADNRSYADFYQDVSLEAQCLLTLPETYMHECGLVFGVCMVAAHRTIDDRTLCPHPRA